MGINGVVVVHRGAGVGVRNILAGLLAGGKDKKEKMTLREAIKAIDCEFYVAVPGKGGLKVKGEYHKFNSEEGLEGLLNRNVMIHPYDWKTLMVEIL